MAGTGAAGKQAVGSVSEKREPETGRKRKRAALVLEKDYALRSGFAGNFGVGFKVGFIRRNVPLEGIGLDYQFQHPPYADVQQGLVELPFPDAPDELGHLRIQARLHKVVPGGNLCRSVAFSGPVGHHQPLEAPFVAQDFRQQTAVLLGMGAVQAVVRRHHGPGPGFLYDYLEIAQVQPAQGLLGHAGIVPEAVGLLVVGGKVLDGGSDSPGLHSVHVSSGNAPAQHRILGEILEVPAAQRVAVDVHAWSEHHVYAVIPGFLAYRSAHGPDHIGIPGA